MEKFQQKLYKATMVDRDKHGHFLSGHKGGPGRPKGSRNKLGEEFVAALCADFEEHGVATIEAVRVERPADYLKLVAALVPRQIDLRHDDDFFNSATDYELRAMLEECLASLRLPQRAQ